MEKYKLGNIATVEISGVDKKMKDGEKEIHLCNFVDVYYNWAITTAQYDTTLAFQLILAMILMMSYWVIIVL